MKKHFLIILLALSSLMAQCQETKTPHLVETPGDWRSEFVTLPFSFAPTMTYKGTAEVRFADGWADKESPEFWTYTFVWQLDNEATINAKELQDNVQAYFDGLMNLVAKDKTKVTKTNALFLELPHTKKEYIGKIKLYDAFFTEEGITLNAKATLSHCNTTNKDIILFRFTLDELGEGQWTALDKVNVIIPCE